MQTGGSAFGRLAGFSSGNLGDCGGLLKRVFAAMLVDNEALNISIT